MLSERLREMVSRLEQLSIEDQDRMAELIGAELDEEIRWQTAMSDSHELVLDQLLTEAKEQAARGEARDLDELL